MILTLTPNTGLDRTLFIPNFSMNHTLRASRSVLGMGAKATDVSWILGEIGVPSMALGFAGGRTGEQMIYLLRSRHATTDFVWVDGETRLNTVVVCEDGSGQFTITAPGLSVQDENLSDLEARYHQSVQTASCVVLGGSLPKGVPPDFYVAYIRYARSRGTPVILDSSGEALAAAVHAAPTLIKPNRIELEELAGNPIATLQDAYRAAQTILTQHGIQVVVTLGAEGILAVLHQHAYHIPAIPVDVVSTAGAGDGVTAGLALALSTGIAIEEGLRWGAAIAAAILLTPATADCRKEDVERLKPRVEIRSYPA